MYADMTSVQYIHSTRAERRFGRAPVGICVVQALQRARAKCRMALSGADSPGESPEAFGAPAFAWGKYTPFSFVVCVSLQYSDFYYHRLSTHSHAPLRYVT